MTHRLFLGLLFLFCLNRMLPAQIQFIGGGEGEDVMVTTSSDHHHPVWEKTASGDRTIDGAGMDGDLMEASRFLSQATLGADVQLIEEIAEMGIEAWLEDQLNQPSIDFLEETERIHEEWYQWHLAQGGDPDDFEQQITWLDFMYAWWSENLFNDDLVRQRVALALSEILVISFQSDLSFYGRGLASYYDVLSDNAFGNYKDLLMDVTLHPCMGFYLSHMDNPKAIPEENIHPDENYAREIMQLFTIGLYELNPDGTQKLDDEGKPIPTYNNDDIKEMAKVFTGLGAGAVVENEWIDYPVFDLGIYLADLAVPLQMYEFWHQQGEKHLLNGYVIPAGQSGMDDVEDAVEHLFNHPNVGPFIGKQLIQRLVKSNPSPAYVERVASAFNDNGFGVRGDMKAVIRAILLDEEARSCEWLQHPENGKLREPLLRYTHAARAISIDQAFGRFWNLGYSFFEQTGQAVLASPSVFNFFLPYYQPNGPIADAGLIAPEFQIHNAKTSVGFLNAVFFWTMYDSVMETWMENNPPVSFDYYTLEPLARDNEVLINELDILFTHGNLTDDTRSIMKEALNGLYWSEYKENRVRLALYLMLISPDYAIFK